MTAAEAYPALELAFLSAQTEIHASFLIFDLSTPLQSDQAKAIGKTWFDLIVHVLKQGVKLNLTIADADSALRPAMHRAAFQQAELLAAAAAAAAAADAAPSLTVERVLHPGQAGSLLRVLLWPYMMVALRRTCGWLNRQTPDERTEAGRQLPGLARSVRTRPDGTYYPRLWSLPRICTAVHHQKLAVFDRKTLYIGGLDLSPGYVETSDKARAVSPWHDLQLIVEGPVVAEAQLHLESFRDIVEGRLPPPRTRRFVRTLSLAAPNLWRLRPEPLVAELRSAHTALARRTDALIYLETQCFQDRKFAIELADRARQNPALGLILMIPAQSRSRHAGWGRDLAGRYNDALQARALHTLRDGFGPRLFVGSPAPAAPKAATGRNGAGGQLAGAWPMHLNARIAIFDDSAALVSSANLTPRSFGSDTEAGIYLSSNNDVQELKYRVMAHWLPENAPTDAFEGPTAVAEWSRIAQANAERPPEFRSGLLLPHELAVADAAARNHGAMQN